MKKKFICRVLSTLLAVTFIPQVIFAAPVNSVKDVNSDYNYMLESSMQTRNIMHKTPICNNVSILNENFKRFGVINKGDACQVSKKYNYCAIHNGYSYEYVDVQSGVWRGYSGWVCLDYLEEDSRFK